jgi:hypothetical protein
VLSGPERRRPWTSADKLRIVEECRAAEAVVAEVVAHTTFVPINFMRGVGKHALAF